MAASTPAFFTDPEIGAQVWMGDGPSVSIGTAADSPAFTDFKPTTIPETNPRHQNGLRNLGVSMHRVGGGAQPLTVRGSVVLDNQGAAESFSHSMLGQLGLTGVGLLVVNNREYPNSFFVGGTARIRRTGQSGFVNYNIRFLRSVPAQATVNNLNFGVPGTPATPIGRNNNGDYTASYLQEGLIVDMGTYTDLSELSAFRPPSSIKQVPRAFGVRMSNVYSRRGFLMRMNFRTTLRADFNLNFGSFNEGNVVDYRGSVENKMLQVASLVGRDAPFTVTGNGNVFDNVFFTNFTPDGEDSWQTVMGNIEAVQELTA